MLPNLLVKPSHLVGTEKHLRMKKKLRVEVMGGAQVKEVVLKIISHQVGIKNLVMVVELEML